MKLLLTSILTAVSFTNVSALAATASLTPFEVANAAYNGSLKEQGISSFGGLCDDLFSRAVTSTDVMNAAVKAKLLNPTDANSEFSSYLQMQLEGLCH